MNRKFCFSNSLIRWVFLSLIFFYLQGCAGNYSKVSLGEISGNVARDSFAQIVLEDSDMAYMAEFMEEIKKIPGVKEPKITFFEGRRCVSFWVPIRFGGDGKDTATLSLLRGETRRGKGLGIVINTKWGKSFPRYSRSLILLELNNDTGREFVSGGLDSYGADFNGRSSMFYKTHIAPGESVKTILVVDFNPERAEGIAYDELSYFEAFLLEVEPKR
ncbi:hypothetical protein [Pseudomonas sp. GCEP-101]|uniref:hypothetical protein n=1 Tax=Pseudomonas sp. GCEP-101 TaxID=2974552 RepID=UPI00223B9C87|nr:hypothetical protein [Pseudomonas sp. GCEP-101]